MNKGERNELLIKIFLAELKKRKDKSTVFGEIKNLGFGGVEYKVLDEEIDYENLDDKQIKLISQRIGIEKSSPLNKADVFINDVAYSIKYMDAGLPSLINHTNRIGFLRIANCLGENIKHLDNLIKKYWDLRISKKISEDCSNKNILSPFRESKNILRPYLEYFCFKGTGRSDSKYPAQFIFKFSKFNDPSSWKLYSKSEAVNLIWNGLFFCIRDIGKSGVKDYEKSIYKEKLEPWTKFSTNKYRGALSVRYKAK